MRLLVSGAVVVLVLLYSEYGVTGMFGIFDKAEVHLSPEVGGVVTLARISHRSPASLADCAGYRHYRSFAAEID